MSTSASLQKLIQIPICKGLSAAEAKAVFDIAEELSVARGTHVFEEGDPGDGVYVLLEGAAEIVKQEQTLAKLSDGSVIGEMSLISGNAARSATAVATTDCR